MSNDKNDNGMILDIDFYNKKTMNKYFENNGFELIKFIEPKDWNIENDKNNICTMNKYEQNIRKSQL